MAQLQDKKLVVVIGAGIIGLTTARFLLEAGYRVKVFGRDLPGDLNADYASPWAGAIWGPGIEESPEMRDWYTQSYQYFHDMWTLQPNEAKEAGVAFRKRIGWQVDNPFPPNTPFPKKLWYSDLVGDLEVLDHTSLPEGYAMGCSYTTFCIDTPTYLTYLHAKILSLGGSISRHVLPSSMDSSFSSSLKELANGQDVLAFVNATGLGSKELVGDLNLFPTRGQTVFVRGEAEKISIQRGKDALAYVIPRVGSNLTLLGGTMEEGDWEATPRPDVTERILRECKALAPELLDVNGEFEVLRQNVGRRPSRQGGLRIELEEFKEGLKFVHCYGHGGEGYEKSIGSSNKVVEAVNSIKDAYSKA